MRIALVTEKQYESLVDLLCELHAYYNDGAAVSRETVRAHLLENLLAIDSPIRLVVAALPDDRVVGLAAIALLYSVVESSPDRRRQCLVKELFVRSSARSQGVGRALMEWVARYAVESGCCRMDWPVNASNRGGISFYEGLGAEHVVERLSYRLSAPNMERLAREHPNAKVGA